MSLSRAYIYVYDVYIDLALMLQVSVLKKLKTATDPQAADTNQPIENR